MAVRNIWRNVRAMAGAGAGGSAIGSVLLAAGMAVMAAPAMAEPFDWSSQKLTINIKQLSCQDYLDITLDGKNGRDLVVWIDGWLTGERMGGTFHGPHIRARLQHWREHCLAETGKPLLEVLRGTKFEPDASSELVGLTSDELHIRETVVVQGFRCEPFLEMVRTNKGLAEQVARWLDGWHAGNGADPYYRPNKIADQLKGIMNTCYTNPRKTLLAASAGKFR